jgi:class 3 adenylate cyclase
MELSFLFTDVEGSSRLWEIEPGAMESALAQHDEIIRLAVESEGGTVVKGTGDGFMAAFPAPIDAVAAAVAAQLALRQGDFEEVDGLPVRMGIHLGEA